MFFRKCAKCPAGDQFSCASVVLFLVLIGFLHTSSAQEVKCGHPAVPVNAQVGLSSPDLKAGTTALYTCDDGYETFGNTILTCTAQGKWSGELPFCGTNIAYRKPANQSTTVRGGVALNANDGEKSNEHDGKRCSETQKEVSPWWHVDLLRPYPVKVVRVTTRGCCGHQPLQDLEIRVGNSSSDLQRNPLCAWFPGTIDEGVTKTFTCARSLVGQYVFLQLVGVEGSLSLCEVEVFTTDEFSIDRCAPKAAAADAELAAFARTCYEFRVNRGGSFAEARNYCKGFNGDLAHGMNPGQTSFLYSELERRKPQLKTQLVWIGAQKEPGLTSRTWKWVNGDMVVRPSWGKDQPNNYNGEQNCAVLDGGRGWLWNDVGCNLDYLPWICQHNPSSCGSPDKQLNSTISGSNYSIGGLIQYRCPDGHMLVGNASRSCGKEGFWSGSAPTCKYIDCGGLPDLEHGSVTLVGGRSTFGAVAKYACHENYTLTGIEQRKCEEHGIWSEKTPQCLFDWCPDPPEINGGIVKVTGHRNGDTATYVCQSGYILFGQAIISCQKGGEWSGKAPSCKYVDCGSPPYIGNGRYELLNSTTTVDSIVEYSCGDDYWLDGDKVQRCGKEGKWSSDAPSCELIDCEEPDVPSGSYVIGYDFNVHSTITYNCEVGHILRGEQNRTCMRDGVWSGSTPTCEYIDCGKVPSLLYGNTDYINETTYLDSQISYSCTRNYRLTGVPRRICLENRQWSDNSPKCEEIRCPDPVLPEHGILSVTGNDRMYGRTIIRTAESGSGSSTYKIGALVKYRCERGHKVVGEPLSTCEDTGQWSGSVPQCIFVDCGDPAKFQNGVLNLASNATYYGAGVLYTCDANFELDGVKRRSCLENGTWSSDAPSCKEIQCKDPDTFEGVSFQVSTHSVGGIAKYGCPKGHEMQGNSTRVCLEKGSWSGRAPSCKAVDCKRPPQIQNGRVIVANGTVYTSSVEYHCIPEFKRIGAYIRKCMENGHWSGEEPTCEVSIGETEDPSSLGTNIGIGSGIVIVILIILGLIYLKLRRATPVKNTENVEAAERKEDRNAAVMSYSTLSDRNGYGGSHLGPNIYENIHDENMYDAPYEETSRDSGTYEPEPVGRNGNVVTINGVSVR
ncbi:PREDICTED: sushi, von Willebrand factor type A, EGF and pentraxin domain-containing protein 1 [Nicrophorus vespilloides]|uniref:Sushi, von Willebrand factor type A, EGF and pentraxin domain-containing protein 1 n=1 Tax=Nicrophorus vespilloides TaxID=110193 RepID=A0ABM1MED2_NICVS|nr:PREDICTED: sushi, von Willebrand factor type A, EGF and pentraxin domain-containing protein 1 [Nicrophorus vespilloides]